VGSVKNNWENSEREKTALHKGGGTVRAERKIYERKISRGKNKELKKGEVDRRAVSVGQNGEFDERKGQKKKKEKVTRKREISALQNSHLKEERRRGGRRPNQRKGGKRGVVIEGGMSRERGGDSGRALERGGMWNGKKVKTERVEGGVSMKRKREAHTIDEKKKSAIWGKELTTRSHPPACRWEGMSRGRAHASKQNSNRGGPPPTRSPWGGGDMRQRIKGCKDNELQSKKQKKPKKEAGGVGKAFLPPPWGRRRAQRLPVNNAKKGEKVIVLSGKKRKENVKRDRGNTLIRG